MIDGSLADWNLDSPAVVDDASQIIRDGVVWQGANDCSAKFYLAWDEDNLYIAADVTEDSPLGAIEMLPIDGEDNLMLYISTDPTADPNRTEYGTNDFLIYFVMDEGFWDTAIDRSMVPKDARQRFVSLGMDGGESVLPGYTCAVQMTATGFTWEAQVPWADLSEQNTLAKKNKVPLYTPAAGDVLLCNFEITDISYPCPGTEYIPQLAWTGNCKIQTNPSLWGTVIVLRLSAEFYDMTYTSDTLLVQVSDANLKYDSISITGVPAQGTNTWKPFNNYTISTAVALQKGTNTIKLIVNNEDRLSGRQQQGRQGSLCQVLHREGRYPGGRNGRR